jgi:hypothetical protein
MEASDGPKIAPENGPERAGPGSRPRPNAGEDDPALSGYAYL